MSNTSSSQVQQNPFTQAVTEGIEAHLARVEAFYAQLADVETKALEQSKTALEESARLSRESFAYGSTLAAEWRRVSLEATRNALRMMSSTPAFPFMG